jgi:type IV pilus assembly protein PilX
MNNAIPVLAGKPAPHSTALDHQAGITLFLTLIALVSMTLAAIAMMRSIDTGNIVAGNLALKQGASQESDVGINVAFNCLDKNGALITGGNLDANNATCNYYASLQPDSNKPFGVPDVLESASTLPTNPTTGYTVSFVIERMCNLTGTFENAKCIPSPFGRKESKISARSNNQTLIPPQALYRISVKTSGPRNVATYSQMIMSATQ